MTPALRKRIEEEASRQLSAAEAAAYLAAPVTEAERESFREMREWFCRRYPTPAERLAYVRRAYRRWVGSPDR